MVVLLRVGGGVAIFVLLEGKSGGKGGRGYLWQNHHQHPCVRISILIRYLVCELNRGRAGSFI